MKAPTKEQLLADIQTDATWKEISQKYGYSDSRFIRKLANRYGLPKRRTVLKPSEEELRKMILSDGLTPQKVAEKLRYGENGWSNIYAYCREYGIKFDFSVNHGMRSIPFTTRQKEIALGSLLGDAYLRPSGKSYCLSFTHGENQKGYLEWKLSEFSNFVATKKLYRRETNFNGNLPTYSFSTITHPYLFGLHELCYPGGVKVVTMEWLKKLSPLSLAVWYLDDGSLNKRYGTIVLCTNCFTREEQETIVEYLSSVYGIDSKIEPRRNDQSVVRINASQRQKFFDLISTHIPDCMSYKLG